MRFGIFGRDYLIMVIRLFRLDLRLQPVVNGADFANYGFSFIVLRGY